MNDAVLVVTARWPGCRICFYAAHNVLAVCNLFGHQYKWGFEQLTTMQNDDQ